jgi:hypothetical protein
MKATTNSTAATDLPTCQPEHRVHGLQGFRTAVPPAPARAQSCCTAACGLWGWSPPLLVADTSLKRAVDRILPRTGLPVFLFFALVIVLLGLAAHLALRGELALDGLAALAGGGWCSLNFWRCRQAHCLVCGAGWLALSVFAFAEAALGRTLIAGDEQLVLLGILVAALAFEALWTWARRTNAVVRGRPQPPLASPQP